MQSHFVIRRVAPRSTQQFAKPVADCVVAERFLQHGHIVADVHFSADFAIACGQHERNALFRQLAGDGGACLRAEVDVEQCNIDLDPAQQIQRGGVVADQIDLLRAQFLQYALGIHADDHVVLDDHGDADIQTGIAGYGVLCRAVAADFGADRRDLRLRVPDWIEGLEAQVRALVTPAVARGSVTLSLRISREATAVAFALNQTQLGNALAALADVEAQAMDRGVTLAPSNACEILALPGLFAGSI